MLSLCCVRGGGSKCWWWPVLGVLRCSWVEQDIHELLTWVQRPKVAFILCPSRLKMEVAGGKSRQGEGRHSLLRSSLLSHRRWWIAPGREWVGNPFQGMTEVGWQRSCTSVSLSPPHCSMHRGSTFAPGRAEDLFVPVLVSPGGDWQMQKAAASLLPLHALNPCVLSAAHPPLLAAQHFSSSDIPISLCLPSPCPFGCIPNPIFLS